MLSSPMRDCIHNSLSLPVQLVPISVLHWMIYLDMISKLEIKSEVFDIFARGSFFRKWLAYKRGNHANAPKSLSTKPIYIVSLFMNYLSLNSWLKIFCQRSIHFCCCDVRALPGFLKERVRMSFIRLRNDLIASMVFQSETANRARFPSITRTPAYIYG